MRVIAGSAKGVRLAPVPRGVRPLSDRAREGLFSSLGDLVPDAVVLDLYAGTGAVGIEALSRGASHATFVERDPGALRTLRGNLARAELADRASVAASDVHGFLRQKSKTDSPIDLCFLDPPYDVPISDVSAAIRTLAAGWLAEGGFTVALTRRARSSMPVIPVDWRTARGLEYGDTLVVLYREV